MPHTHKACQNKREKKEIAPIQRKRKRNKREMIHTKEYIHHPPKISTHLHILIKIYDLFLLWIQFLIWQSMRSKFAFIPSITIAPPKRSLQSRMERKAQK
jgi:hypothetical protein